MRYGCSPTSSTNRMPASTRGRYGVPTRWASSARLPPHSVPCGRQILARQRAADLVARGIEHAPAMLHRVGGDLFGAEIVRAHRPGESHHVRGRQRGELEGGEVAVPQPSRAARRDGGEVETLEQARPSVSAAQGDRELDARILGHAHHRGETVVVRTPKNAAIATMPSGRRPRDGRRPPSAPPRAPRRRARWRIPRARTARCPRCGRSSVPSDAPQRTR